MMTLMTMVVVVLLLMTTMMHDNHHYCHRSLFGFLNFGIRASFGFLATELNLHKLEGKVHFKAIAATLPESKTANAPENGWECNLFRWERTQAR